MNYSDEDYEACEQFLKTEEGTVLVSNKDKSIKVNLMAFIDDMIERKITQRELRRLKKPVLLDAKGRRVN